MIYSIFTVLTIGTVFVRSVSDSNVIEMDATNFDNELQSTRHMLAMFHAPWCGHCQKLSPEFDKAANHFSDPANIKFGKIDCHTHTSFKDRYEIKGFPTLYFFKGQNKSEYTGGRSASDIITWVTKHIEYPIQSVTNFMECVSIASQKGAFLLKTRKEDALFKKFEKYADEFRTSGTFCHMEADDNKFLFKHQDEDEEESDFHGITPESFKITALPLFAKINGYNVRDYVEKPFALVWVVEKDSKFDQVSKIYRPIAKIYKGRAAFVFLDSVEFGGHATNGLELQGDNGVVIEKDRLRYHLPNQADFMNAEVVKQFMEDFFNGNVKERLRSEDIPTTNDNSPIVKVVALNFEKEVTSSEKDVLLKVYAPWCQHCIQMQPAYLEVADQVKQKNLNVKVAEIDATKNDLPKEFDIKGFPTLIYVRKGMQIPYEGDRTAASMMAFIEKHAQVSEMTSDEL